VTTPETYHQAGIRRGTVTQRSTLRGTTSFSRSLPLWSRVDRSDSTARNCCCAPQVLAAEVVLPPDIAHPQTPTVDGRKPVNRRPRSDSRQPQALSPSALGSKITGNVASNLESPPCRDEPSPSPSCGRVSRRRTRCSRRGREAVCRGLAGSRDRLPGPRSAVVVRRTVLVVSSGSDE
jgi:hypothetical protein